MAPFPENPPERPCHDVRSLPAVSAVILLRFTSTNVSCKTHKWFTVYVSIHSTPINMNQWDVFFGRSKPVFKRTPWRASYGTRTCQRRELWASYRNDMIPPQTIWCSAPFYIKAATLAANKSTPERLWVPGLATVDSVDLRTSSTNMTSPHLGGCLIVSQLPGAKSHEPRLTRKFYRSKKWLVIRVKWMKLIQF